jgi:hypothetical protein
MQAKTSESETGGIRQLLLMLSGMLATSIGLLGSSFGRAWSPQVYDYLFAFGIVESLDAFLPYFPLVPFYPLLLVMLGAYLIVKSKN